MRWVTPSLARGRVRPDARWQSRITPFERPRIQLSVRRADKNRGRAPSLAGVCGRRMEFVSFRSFSRVVRNSELKCERLERNSKNSETPYFGAIKHRSDPRIANGGRVSWPYGTARLKEDGELPAATRTRVSPFRLGN